VSIDSCLWLDRLAAIFRSCSLPTKEGQTTTHPYMAVIAEIWPTIKSICQLFQNDVIIIERSTRYVPHNNVLLVKDFIINQVYSFYTEKCRYSSGTYITRCCRNGGL